jgi:hypothetical protein
VTGANPETSDPDRLWWCVAIATRRDCPFEVRVPWGYTLAGWQEYAERWYGPGCLVTPLDPLPDLGADPQIAIDAGFRTPRSLRPGMFVRQPPKR